MHRSGGCRAAQDGRAPPARACNDSAPPLVLVHVRLRSDRARTRSRAA